MAAEFLGTFWLVLGGCGSAVLASAFPGAGIGLLGVVLAIGRTVLTMAYAIGHISGGHFNQAVTLGLVSAGRFKAGDAIGYVVVQVLGAVAAAAILAYIASGKPNFELVASGLASNGYGARPPGGYSMGAAVVSEFVMTFFFLIVILGATGKRAPAGFAPIAVGLALTVIHLVSIPVTNISVNPARSTGPAHFAGGWALAQLWLFRVTPIAGAMVDGVVHKTLIERD